MGGGVGQRLHHGLLVRLLQRVHGLGDLLAGLAFEELELVDEPLQALGVEYPTGHTAAEQIDQAIDDAVGVADHFSGVGRPVELTEPLLDVAAHPGRQAVQNPPHGPAAAQHAEHILECVAEDRYQGDEAKHQFDPVVSLVAVASELVERAEDVIDIHGLADPWDTAQYHGHHHLRNGFATAFDDFLYPTEDFGQRVFFGPGDIVGGHAAGSSSSSVRVSSCPEPVPGVPFGRSTRCQGDTGR
ncbi:hypothetical protein D3C81_857890 [compost metagenome]